MKFYIATVIFLLFADRGFAIKEKKPFPRACFYVDGAIVSYENLAKANNHPPNDMANESSEDFWLGMGISYSYSIWDIKAIYQGSYAENNPLHGDTAYVIGEMYTGLKAGIHILPSNLPINFIPEIGCFYLDEYLSKTAKYTGTPIYYNEELKGTSIAPGFSCLWKIIGATFLKFSYFHNNVEKVKMDNYFLELGNYISVTSDNDVFMGIEGGLTTKTDGRKCYYVAIEFGGDPTKVSTAKAEK